MTSVYVLGLYESNTINLMPYLFSSDYSSRTFEGLPNQLTSYTTVLESFCQV